MTTHKATVEQRINKAVQSLSDIDIICENLDELVIRDAQEFLLVKQFREQKRDSMIAAAKSAFSKPKWFSSDEEIKK